MEKLSIFNVQKSEFFTSDLQTPSNVVLAQSDDKKSICTKSNVLVFGASEKLLKNTFIKPNILTCIRNKESYVVTDSNGEVFEDTCALAKEAGYNIRVLNLISDSNSNSWDILKPIKSVSDNTAIKKTEEMADILFERLEERCLFKALMLYLAKRKDFIGTAYNLLSKLIDQDGTLEEFTGGSLEKYARLDGYILNCWTTYFKSPDRMEIASNVLNRLSFLSDDFRKDMFANNEIDFERFNKEKTACYIIAEPFTDEHRLVVSLFLNQLYDTIKANRPERTLRLILSNNKEFGEIKKLPYTCEDLVNASVSLLFQSVNELVETYEEYERLLNCFTVLAVYPVKDTATNALIAERYGQEASNLSPTPKEESVLLLSDLDKPEKFSYYNYTDHILSGYNTKTSYKDYIPEWNMKGHFGYMGQNNIYDTIIEGITLNPLDNPKGVVIGESSGQSACLRDSYDARNNVAVFSCTGAGRTNSYLLPNILTQIANEESFIVADPSGTMYTETADIANQFGYDIKVLNLKNPESSNGWNPLAGLKDLDVDDARTKVMSIVDIIMANRDMGGDEFFAQSKANLLKAIILYVAVSPHFKGRDDERHLGTVYDIAAKLLTQKGNTEEFLSLPGNDPSVAYWKMFNAAGKLKMNFIADVIKDLEFLEFDIVKEMLSHDEIDLSKLGQQKCAYYIMFPFTSTKTRFLTALFVNDVLDAVSGKDYKIPVHVLLDNFRAIGKIGDLPEKLEKPRLSGSSVSIILSSYDELKNQYGNKAENISGKCNLWLAIGVNDTLTADFLSAKSGHIVDGDLTRPVLSENDVLKISGSGKKVLAITKEQKVLIAKAYNLRNHTFASLITDKRANMPVPPWKNGEYNVIGQDRTFAEKEETSRSEEVFNEYLIGDKYEGEIVNITSNGFFVRVNNNIDIFCKNPNNLILSASDTVAISILGKDDKTKRIWGRIDSLV